MRFVGGLLLAALVVLFAASGADRAVHADEIVPISANNDHFAGHAGDNHSQHEDCDHAQAAACASPAMLGALVSQATNLVAPAMVEKRADTERVDGLSPLPLHRPPRNLS